MVIPEPVKRIDVKKDCGITICGRMSADPFPGKKTEAGA